MQIVDSEMAKLVKALTPLESRPGSELDACSLVIALPIGEPCEAIPSLRGTIHLATAFPVALMG
jgi:hypothetical protein